MASAKQAATEEFEDTIERIKLAGANEYLETAEGTILLEEQIEEGMRKYKRVVLRELPGVDLSQVDKQFPGGDRKDGG